MDQKEKRNQEIIKMHNDDKTTREIADALGISKTLVHNVIKDHINSLGASSTILPSNETPGVQTNTPKEPTATVTGKRITNFGEYQRIYVNKYAHKSTGEIITVKFVPASVRGQYGYFVTV